MTTKPKVTLTSKEYAEGLFKAKAKFREKLGRDVEYNEITLSKAVGRRQLYDLKVHKDSDEKCVKILISKGEKDV